MTRFEGKATRTALMAQHQDLGYTENGHRSLYDQGWPGLQSGFSVSLGSLLQPYSQWEGRGSKMAPRMRALPALAEVLGSVPDTNKVTHNDLNSSFRGSDVLPSGLCGSQVCT